MKRILFLSLLLLSVRASAAQIFSAEVLAKVCTAIANHMEPPRTVEMEAKSCDDVMVTSLPMTTVLSNMHSVIMNTCRGGNRVLSNGPNGYYFEGVVSPGRSYNAWINYLPNGQVEVKMMPRGNGGGGFG